MIRRLLEKPAAQTNGSREVGMNGLKVDEQEKTRESRGIRGLMWVIDRV